MPEPDDASTQRLLFKFLQEHFREGNPFAKKDVEDRTGWTEKSTSTYWSKHLEPFVQPIPPILTGVHQKNQRYRVTDVFLSVGSWARFRRHVSQKRRITYEYDHTVFDTVLMFEFFLPLTNETVLRNALDSLFYRDTILKKLLAIGIFILKTQHEAQDGEHDDAYLDRLIAWVGKQFGGYSISHVHGRFRADSVKTMQDAAGIQERGGRYLIDETTSITRFIFPCKNEEDAARVKWFFHELFVQSVIQVAGEAEIWMIESGGGTQRLHVWAGKDEA